MRLVHHLLEKSADQFGDKPAVFYKGAWTNYATLESSANRLARHFKSKGVMRGDRIALLMENSTAYVVAHMAVFKTGCVNVSLNTETTPKTLEYLLEDSGARILVVGEKYMRHVNAMAGIPPSLEHLVIDSESGLVAADRFQSAVFNVVCQQGPDARESSPAIDIDLASILYTSGSTGRPKGVMLSHLNLMSSAKSTVSYLRLTEDDRMMVVLPFHYIYGTSLLYTHLAVGGSIVIENRFLYPNVVLDAMEEHRVTGFAGVPSSFMLLLNRSTLRSRKFESLRAVTQAGGHLAPSIQKQVAEAFSPAKFFVMYGTTEAAPRLTYLEPEQLLEKCGSIGKPVPNVEVFPANEAGERVPVGTIGEIVARGSNIMMGYWHEDAATAEVLRNGLYFTGDLGREDSNGFLFIEGRAKDIIKAGGNRVSAQEVENAVLEVDGVAEAAVIGVEDSVLGEAIKVFVVAKDKYVLSEPDIKAQLQRALPSFKLPKWIVLRTSLPKSSAGKILKAALRDEAVEVQRVA